MGLKVGYKVISFLHGLSELTHSVPLLLFVKCVRIYNVYIVTHFLRSVLHLRYSDKCNLVLVSLIESDNL